MLLKEYTFPNISQGTMWPLEGQGRHMGSWTARPDPCSHFHADDMSLIEPKFSVNFPAQRKSLRMARENGFTKNRVKLTVGVYSGEGNYNRKDLKSYCT